MINNTVIQFIRHNTNRKQPTGFTLTELLMAFMLAAVISGIAIPSYLTQTNKARTTEAKMVLGAMNRSQHFYRFENGSFATTVEDLKLTLSVGQYKDNAYHGTYYVYTVEPEDPQEVHHRAVPVTTYKADAREFISAVRWENSATSNRLCEAYAPNKSPSFLTFNDCTDGYLIY